MADLKQRRMIILKAAGEVFKERGFDRSRTIDVARKANMSKRDLYAVFPSKEALLSALIHDGAAKMANPLKLAHPVTRAEFYAILEKFGSEFLVKQFSPPRLTMLRLMIARTSENSDLQNDADASIRENIASATTALFTSAQKAGLVRFASAERVAQAFLLVLQGDLLMRALLNATFTLGDVALSVRVANAIEVVAALEAAAVA